MASLWTKHGTREERKLMDSQDPGFAPRPVWTYGYAILPPFPMEQLRALEALLEDEYLRARQEARTWVGRFLVEERATHILVVSDSPDQKLNVNVRVEAELQRLSAAFSITPAMEVSDPKQGTLFGNGEPGSFT